MQQNYNNGYGNGYNPNYNQMPPMQNVNPNLKPCPSCGHAVSKTALACPRCGAKIKAPWYEKLLIGMLIFIIVFEGIIILRLSDSGDSSSSNTSDKTVQTTKSDSTSNNNVINTDSADSNIGKYKVEIKGCSLVKDYEGKSVAVVTFSFTNNSSVASSFEGTFEVYAYQNGIEAEDSWYLSDEDYDNNNNQYKDIKPGTTIEVKEAFTLNDTSSPLEVEVGQFFSFDTTKVTKTFTFK
jgi:hypothetical protein